MPDIFFVIPGPPVPFARPGGGATRKRYTPAPQRAYMSVVSLYAKRAMEGKHPFTGPIKLMVQASWPIVKSKPKVMFKTSKPDLDNILKLLKDSLNKICWIDDAQVCVLEASKSYSSKPQVCIWIETINGY